MLQYLKVEEVYQQVLKNKNVSLVAAKLRSKADDATSLCWLTIMDCDQLEGSSEALAAFNKQGIHYAQYNTKILPFRTALSSTPIDDDNCLVQPMMVDGTSPLDAWAPTTPLNQSSNASSFGTAQVQVHDVDPPPNVQASSPSINISNPVPPIPVTPLTPEQQEEHDIRFVRPCHLTIINTPGTHQRDVEDFLGIAINNFDFSATLTDKCTVNWVHFSVEGTVIANSIVDKVNSLLGPSRVLFKNSHLSSDKSREIYIRKVNPVTTIEEVNLWKDLGKLAIEYFASVLDVSFWTGRDFITVTLRDLEVARSWTEKTVTINGVNYPTARYPYVEIRNPSEVIVEGFHGGDVEQIIAMIREIGTPTRQELFYRNSKSGMIIRMESHKQAKALLELPTEYTRLYTVFKVGISWAWAADANTKSLQPKSSSTSNKKGQSSSPSSDSRITAIQNQLKRSEEQGVKELRKLEARMESENNKTRMAMVTLVTENTKAIHQAMNTTFHQVMETQLEILSSSGTVQSLQNELSNTNLMIAIHTMSSTGDKEALEEYKQEQKRLKVQITEENTKQRNILQHKMLLTPQIPATPINLNSLLGTGPQPLLTTPNRNENNQGSTSQSATTSQQSGRKPTMRVEIPLHEELLKLWSEESALLVGEELADYSEVAWDTSLKNIVATSFVEVSGYWIFHATIAPSSKREEILSKMQSFAAVFKSSPRSKLVEEILLDVGVGVFPHRTSK